MNDAADPRNDASAYSEYDDTREFCENCDEVIQDGRPVHRCGEIAWHASCGGPCGECAATTKGAA